MEDWGEVVLLALLMGGCCLNPKPRLEVRDDGCFKMDECNWCCPISPNDTNSGYACTLVACVKELPQ